MLLYLYITFFRGLYYVVVYKLGSTCITIAICVTLSLNVWYMIAIYWVLVSINWLLKLKGGKK